MARFGNKVVLVSGGARGQGAAEVRLLVAQGAKVVIGDVLDNQGRALAVELGPAASLGMKAVVPAMERSGGGSIVNTLVQSPASRARPGPSPMPRPKWALRGMTKSAAIDLGGRKIRVNIRSSRCSGVRNAIMSVSIGPG